MTDVLLEAVIVDCEHGKSIGFQFYPPTSPFVESDTDVIIPGNVSDADMHDMVSAVAGAGVSPIVRVRGPTLPVIKRALDTGAQYAGPK